MFSRPPRLRHLLAPLALLAVVRSAAQPAPTYENIPYGDEPRQVLDLWTASAAPGEQPAPLVVMIHGGGFVKGDKTSFREKALLRQCLDAGMACAAINYRFVSPEVPLDAVLRDSARAVQFLRAHAADYGIDPGRIAAIGSSAGAGTSLWLAFHDDLADPAGADPIARQSTRLTCAGSLSGQFSYNITRWREVFGDEAYARFIGRYRDPRLYGLAADTDLESAEAQAVLVDLDFHAAITPDDPPVYIASSLPTLALSNTSEFLHHPDHSRLLFERCREMGVPVTAEIPAHGIGPSATDSPTLLAFLVAHLLRD